MDEQGQKLLREAAGLPGRFERNAFIVGPAAKGDADSEVVTGTVVLYNASKGYGVVRATASDTEAFFSKDGLADDVVGLKEGDAVTYLEDHEPIEDQVCAIEVRRQTDIQK